MSDDEKAGKYPAGYWVLPEMLQVYEEALERALKAEAELAACEEWNP